jgi:predicted NodU family carbamoyl transferase
LLLYGEIEEKVKPRRVEIELRLAQPMAGVSRSTVRVDGAHALAAVTHVNGTARIQTVSSLSNRKMYDLPRSFKARTGFGVLCNTSLNFNGRGFINKIDQLSDYVIKHNSDGFVVEDKAYFLRASKQYQAYQMAE